MFRVVGLPPDYLIGEFTQNAQDYFHDPRIVPRRVNFRDYFSHIKDNNGNYICLKIFIKMKMIQ
jgi:hypothetical protein